MHNFMVVMTCLTLIVPCAGVIWVHRVRKIANEDRKEAEKLKAAWEEYEREVAQKGLEMKSPAQVAACKILGLDPKKKFSEVELKKAYRQHVKLAHPDMGGTEDQFLAVQNAYSELSA